MDCACTPSIVDSAWISSLSDSAADLFQILPQVRDPAFHSLEFQAHVRSL